MTRTMRTDRGLDRLVNFSDATVAIAITLLLLPLVDIADEIRRESLGDLLADHVGTLIAFFVSFVVISRLWLSHHRLFAARFRVGVAAGGAVPRRTRAGCAGRAHPGAAGGRRALVAAVEPGVPWSA
jgi:hypothetical protein